MEHRAQMMGAMLTVESKPGTGTTVTCRYVQPVLRAAATAGGPRRKPD